MCAAVCFLIQRSSRCFPAAGSRQRPATERKGAEMEQISLFLVCVAGFWRAGRVQRRKQSTGRFMWTLLTKAVAIGSSGRSNCCICRGARISGCVDLCLVSVVTSGLI